LGWDFLESRSIIEFGAFPDPLEEVYNYAHFLTWKRLGWQMKEISSIPVANEVH